MHHRPGAQQRRLQPGFGWRQRRFATPHRGEPPAEHLERRLSGGTESIVGAVEPIAVEHEPKQGRVHEGEAHIGDADRDQRGAAILLALGGFPHGLGQPRIAGRGDGGEQSVGVAEVMRGRRVRDAGAARAFAQRKSVESALGQDGLGGGDERRGEVAVMIGRRALPALGLRHGARAVTRELFTVSRLILTIER